MKIFEMEGYTPSPEEMENKELAYNIEDDKLSLKINTTEVIDILAQKFATQAEVDAGIIDNKAISPKTVPRCNRNILIDGEVGRINQSGFDGNWGNVTNYNYGYDMWRIDGSNMNTIVEEGNYKPNSIYTLSIDGVKQSEETSPSSGNWWTAYVPQNSKNVQLELGTVATEFEILPYSDQLARVQRYYEVLNIASTARYSTAGNFQHLLSYGFVDKVSIPTGDPNINATNISTILSYQTRNTISIVGNVTASPGSIEDGIITLDARL